MNHTLSNPDDFTLPATKGSLNILRDASTSAGSQLSIVLFTSSIVTMLDPRNGADHVYSESDHGDFFEQEAQRLGAEAPSRILYVASKVAAEKVVWQYKNELQVRYSDQTSREDTLMSGKLAAILDLHYSSRCGDWPQRSTLLFPFLTARNSQTYLEPFLGRGEGTTTSLWQWCLL